MLYLPTLRYFQEGDLIGVLKSGRDLALRRRRDLTCDMAQQVAKRTRVAQAWRPPRQSQALGECPVCFNEMSTQGAHTVVRPFNCGDGTRHALCRACDRRMWLAHDDRCMICRASRSTESAVGNGERPPGVPVHERRENGVDFGSFEVLHFTNEETGPFVSAIVRPGGNVLFSNLHDMIVANQRSRAERGLRRVDGLISSGGRRGVRISAPAPDATDEEAADFDRDLQAAIAASVASTENAIAAALDEPATRAAMEGLRDPTSTSLAGFIDRVQRTARLRQTRRELRSGSG